MILIYFVVNCNVKGEMNPNRHLKCVLNEDIYDDGYFFQYLSKAWDVGESSIHVIEECVHSHPSLQLGEQMFPYIYVCFKIMFLEGFKMNLTILQDECKLWWLIFGINTTTFVRCTFVFKCSWWII